MPRLTPFNILIVDDNKNNLTSLKAILTQEIDNITVFQEQSGLSALSFLMRQIVDLIILDIQMPQMDGFETAKMIQSRTKTRDIPIVFLTAAYKSNEFRKKGYDLGAVDYLTKPIDSDKFIHKIQTYLRFIQHGDRYNLNQQQEQGAKTEGSKVSTQEGNVLKQVDYLISEIDGSFKTIIGFNKTLEENILSLGYNNCLPEIQKISLESKRLLDMINDVLKPKIKEGKK